MMALKRSGRKVDLPDMWGRRSHSRRARRDRNRWDEGRTVAPVPIRQRDGGRPAMVKAGSISVGDVVLSVAS